MASTAPAAGLARALQEHVSFVMGEVDRLTAEARARALSDGASQLNQIARRIRQATSREELYVTVVDAAASFASGAALLVVEGESVRAVKVRGLDEARAQALSAPIPLAEAPALADAVAQREPVIASASASEVSAPLAAAAGDAPEARVAILPIVEKPAAEQVPAPALLCAWGSFEMAALELVAQVASPAWTATAAPPQEASGHSGRGWEDLSEEERRIHLRAQRFASVKVAEIRLFDADAVQLGRARRNLYAVVKDPVDRARTEFRETFFAATDTMVDYLHLELVRTLANDDPELMGRDYPGPLA
ncbi:MAG: hypothetical protein ACLQVN_02745 [Bryobacteraceae bacterium]